MTQLLERNAAERICTDCAKTFCAGRWAKYCPICRPLHRRSKRMRFVLDGSAAALLRERYDGGVPGRAAEIARQLGWPAWAVKTRASWLGLARPGPAGRRDWTPEEERFLVDWEGLRSAKWIGRHLGRGQTSVVLKMRRIQLSRRVREGYAVSDLSRCFGVEHHSIDRWIRLGWLALFNYGAAGQAGEYSRASERAVLKFIRTHRMEVDLKKVDPLWFLGLILGSENGETT